LHPYVKTQKAAVVVEHFKSLVRPLLGGEAKAMVVCESREEAVQWKRALDREIEKHGHEDVKTLVAFSGEVTVKSPEADNKGMSYTEPEMNKIAGRPLPESKLPEECDKPGYGVLIVAGKYQTDFDQPKLCGMYVDKKLVCVNAVQTLSRLNRSHLGKDRVYVLDFRNTGEEIRKAFAPYYGQTEATPSDPNVLFDAADAVRAFDVITDQELRSSRRAGRRCKSSTRTTPRGAVHVDPMRLRHCPRTRCRHPAGAARRAEPVHPLLRLPLPGAAVHSRPDTEVLYQFSKVLLRRLQSDKPQGGVDLAGQIVLTHYRIAEADAEAVTLAARSSARSTR
jgi:type I restriction enzyme R subunit